MERCDDGAWDPKTVGNDEALSVIQVIVVDCKFITDRVIEQKGGIDHRTLLGSPSELNEMTSGTRQVVHSDTKQLSYSKVALTLVGSAERPLAENFRGG